ncbi:MAG TPA: hypothetical protein VFF79_18130 [Conexibacter sp.]|nr:hypothetical protein [Conexibacter sp.]
MNVTKRRRTCSGSASVVSSVARRRIVSSTIRISYSAKLAPRQRRMPPPNGSHS